ncbi:MAG: haloacid dehalogenase type II [Nocardioidaceae bacterium]
MAPERNRPGVLLLDVNETLSDLSPLAARCVEVGVPASLAGLWFATVLRDGFALTVAGESRPFADVARSALVHLLGEQVPNRPVEEAADHVLAGFSTLEPHADVPHGVRLLVDQGYRVVTLSNGAASVAERLLAEAELREHVELVLSVEDGPGGAWKPARSAYAWAAERVGVEPGEMLMVASHPWDLQGAASVGLATAWVNRSASSYPTAFAPPTYTVAGFEELAEVLA